VALGDSLGGMGFPRIRRSRTPSLFVALPTEADGVPKLLRPGSRRKLRCYLKNAAQAGGFEIERCQSKAELQDWFAQLIALHQRRWTARGERGVFASSRFLEFHRRIAPLLFEEGKLALYAISQRGCKIAIIYGFRHGKTISAYQSGFDVRFNAKISLGLVVYALCLEEAVRSGAAEWDFLRGEEPYKKLWPVDMRRYADIHIWKRRAKPTMARYAFLARGRIHSLLRKCLDLCSVRRT
jgi:CelD/BcsL family acetyltransferase involved in cellulose biosynthesis